MQSIPGSAGRMWILKSIRDILQNAPPANFRLMDNVPMKEKINCKLLQKRAAALMCCSPIFKSYVHGNGLFSLFCRHIGFFFEYDPAFLFITGDAILVDRVAAFFL